MRIPAPSALHAYVLLHHFNLLDTTTDCFAAKAALAFLKNMRIPALSALHAYVLLHHFNLLDTTTDCFAAKAALAFLKNMRIPALSALHAYVLLHHFNLLDTTTDCFAAKAALAFLKNMRIPALSALHAYVLACPKSPWINMQARLSMGFCPLLYQADNGTRTRDLRITNATHYHLCYISITFCKASLIYHLLRNMSIINFIVLSDSIYLDLLWVM